MNKVLDENEILARWKHTEENTKTLRCIKHAKLDKLQSVNEDLCQYAKHKRSKNYVIFGHSHSMICQQPTIIVVARALAHLTNTVNSK